MADSRQPVPGNDGGGDGRPAGKAARQQAGPQPATPLAPQGAAAEEFPPDGAPDGVSGPESQAKAGFEGLTQGSAGAPPDAGAAATSSPAVPLEQHQRLLAEFDNYRKRVERERAREAQWAQAEILGKLLAVMDDMDRARDAVAAGELSFDRDGMLIIMDRFAEVLKREGLVEVQALPGDLFDPNIHEAVLMVPSAEVPEGCIAAVLEKGYRVGERLLRPAKVAVARAPENQCAAE